MKKGCEPKGGERERTKKMVEGGRETDGEIENKKWDRRTKTTKNKRRKEGGQKRAMKESKP